MAHLLRDQYFQGIQAVFLDLDGTLVDSAADILRALNLALIESGLTAVTDAQVRRWVGRGASRLIHCALTQLNAACLHDQVLQRFMHHYQASVCVDSQIYEGVLPFLDWCQRQGIKLACITNKPYQPAKDLLSALSLDQYFSLLLGGDSVTHKKPHPESLQHALSYYQLQPNQAIMIGDSRNDVEAAHAARLRCIALNYGYNHGEDILACQPDLVLDSLSQLL